MKKVSGYISVRALGTYEYEFFVEDDATKEEIEKIVKEKEQISRGYTVGEGYKKVNREEYLKEDE